MMISSDLQRLFWYFNNLILKSQQVCNIISIMLHTYKWVQMPHHGTILFRGVEVADLYNALKSPVQIPKICAKFLRAIDHPLSLRARRSTSHNAPFSACGKFHLCLGFSSPHKGRSPLRGPFWPPWQSHKRQNASPDGEALVLIYYNVRRFGFRQPRQQLQNAFLIGANAAGGGMVAHMKENC